MSSLQNKNALFTLIKSLTGSEKRHFKIFASKHTIGDGNIYVLLFDLLEKSEVFDEEAILQKEKRFKKSSFATLKNYLYDLVLKSLKVFHAESSIDFQLYGILQEVEILFKKDMYDTAKKFLVKGKKICYDYEKFNFLLAMINWEVKIRNLEVNLTAYENQVEQLSAERKETLKKIALVNEYELLKNKVYVLTAKFGTANTKDELKQVKNVIKPYLTSGTLPLPFYAQRLRSISLGLYFYVASETENCYLNNRTVVKLFDSNEKIRNEEASAYLDALNNLIISMIEGRKFAEAEKQLHVLKNIHRLIPAIEKSVILKAAAFLTHADNFLVMHIRQGDFVKGYEFMEEIEKGLKIHEPYISKRCLLALYYNMAFTSFGNKNYKRTLSRINKIIHERDNGLPVHIQSRARILSLIVHFELGNQQLSEYLNQSPLQFLNKKDRLYDIERILIKYMRKLAKTGNSKQDAALFNAMNAELEISRNLPVENSVPVLAWVRSKIEKRNFPEIIREQETSPALEDMKT